MNAARLNGRDVVVTAKPRRLRLDDCGDTLSIAELCAVFGISRAEYFRMKSHRTLPVQPLPGLPHRFARIQVQRFFEGRIPTEGRGK